LVLFINLFENKNSNSETAKSTFVASTSSFGEKLLDSSNIILTSYGFMLNFFPVFT
jgi:amino acid permease